MLHPAKAARIYAYWERLLAHGGRPARYAVALLCTVLVTGGMALSGLALEPANISLIYLLGVLCTATAAGLGPGIVASVLSFLTYNFFFVEPLYILTVANPQDVVRLLSFLIAAMLTSSLAGLAHRQARLLGRRAAQLEALYAASQATSAAVDLDQILPALARTTVDLLHLRACVLTVASEPSQSFTAPPGAASMSMRSPIELPLRIEERVIGSLHVLPQSRQVLQPSERRLLEMLASQAALAIERARLVGQTADAQALTEADRLKSALLSSVSHDLRTPLVAIKGIATALQQHDVAWESAAGMHMLDTISDEADRLNRLVGDLLDMSRIESGALHPAREWEDIGDLIGGVLVRLRPRMRGRTIQVHTPEALPLVWVSAGQIDQVLTNLLENALKYTPTQASITVSVAIEGDMVVTCVADGGPGITADALPYIFDKFFRVIGPERHADGTGLGLAICKGIVEAHGGRIWANNRREGGAEICFTLPIHPAGVPQPPALDMPDPLVGSWAESDHTL